MTGKPRKARKGSNSFAFTDTERRILDLIGEKWGYVRIAQAMRYKVKTVETYVERIADKLPPQGDLKGHKKVLAWKLTQRAA